MLKIATPGREAYGTLVAGINPQRGFDDAYADFFRLVSANIADAIAAVQALEDERRRAAALAELDRAKTAFFSNVSHEFRTPLTLMLGPLEDVLAKRRATAARDRRAQLVGAQRNGQRLLKLVNTLLDFARIEAGRTQASYQPTDLAALTAELASNFRSACERAGLRSRSTARRWRNRPTSTTRCGRRSSSTCSPTPSSSRSTARSGRAARSRRTDCELERERHRHRHPRGVAAAHVRALPPRGGRARAAATRAAASASRWSTSW